MDHSTFEFSLVEFLGCFKHLKKLKYNLEYDYDADGGVHFRYELVSPLVSQAIGHLSDTLEDLSITQDKYREADDPEAIQPLSSLAKFKKLRKLEASAEVLLGSHISDGDVHYQRQQLQHFVHMLPESLERLTIKNCDASILDPVMILVTTGHHRDWQKSPLNSNQTPAPGLIKNILKLLPS